ncbi:MAG: formyltransferase family protein [Thiolinea sp.]
MTAITQTPRRVLFCTYPSLYSEQVLELLLRDPELELVGVVLSTRVLRKSYGPLRASWQQIRRSGLRYAVYLWLVTRGYRWVRGLIRRADVWQQLQQRSIPLLSSRDINDAEGLAFLERYPADFMLSAHFNQRVGPAILTRDGLCCLNIHPSLLPELRGVDPAFYALLRGRQRTGVTVHMQEAEFDSGRILAQQPLTVRWHDSVLSLNIKLFRLGALQAVEQMRQWQTGEQGTAQVAGGEYDSWPDVAAVRTLRRQRKLWRWREWWRLARCPAQGKTQPPP